jgi:excisionase family DNA binding protein
VTKVNPRISDNLAFDKAGSEGCSVCRDLLVNLSRFFDMLDAARQHNMSDLLTVDEVASKLRISKSEVYRLIHHGQIVAVKHCRQQWQNPTKRSLPDRKVRLKQLSGVQKGQAVYRSACSIATIEASAEGEESSWTIALRLLLITRSVCSEIFWTYVLAILTSA